MKMILMPPQNSMQVCLKQEIFVDVKTLFKDHSAASKCS